MRSGEQQGRPATATATVVGLVLAAFFVAFGALHYGFYTHDLLQDTPLYERYGDAIVHHGQLPYRDFSIEYPPGALPVFAAPSLLARAGDFLRYREMFEVLMLLCGAVASAAVGVVLARQRASTTRLAAGTLLAGLAPLALGPVVLSRFDLWPAMLTVVGLAALVGDRRRAAAAVLGCAVAAKLYPAVVLPLAIAYVWRRAGRREALGFTGIAVGTVLAWFAPFLALAPHGVWASLAGQAGRPLQIETLGSAFLLAAHQAWGLPLTMVASHGSDNLAGALPNALAAVQSLLAPAAIVATWVAFVRGEATRERLLRFSAAAICAFVVLEKVLSPQYLVWLIALVPLVRGRRGAVASALFVAAMVLTQLWFPQHYLVLAYGFDARASWFVLARDLSLLALLVTLVAPERRGARGWRLSVSAVAVLALAAVAASAAAGARLATSTSFSRTGLLDETGVASTCAQAKPVPATSSGTVRYRLTGYPASTEASCVTVTVRPLRGAQLFAAAYVDSFDPALPGRNYLGDLGTCTNSGVARTPSFSFRVPANRRFVVEVEECGSTTQSPDYALATKSKPLAHGSS